MGEPVKSVLEVTQSDFTQEVISCRIPVLIDFAARWCSPCQRFAPVFEDVAREYAGMVKFVRVDGDRCPVLAQAFDVGAYPTLVLVRDSGRVRIASTGYLTREQLREFINYALRSEH